MGITGQELLHIIREISQTIEENKEFLTELDGAIGDGDHGINMNKGFKAVVEKLNSINSVEDTGQILKTVGMTLVSNVGGASGPLYGTAFMKAGTVVQGKNEINFADFVKMLDEAVKGIKTRGKAEAGEKTMLDALIPAYNQISEAFANKLTFLQALQNARDSAYQGVEDTKKIKATKGRASYLGERSIGHQDPGATSSYLILDTILKTVKELY